MKSRQQGTVLIMVLLLSALLATLTVAIFHTGQTLQSLHTNELHSKEASGLAKCELLNSLRESMSHPTNGYFDCLTKQQNVGKTTIQRSLCLAHNLPPANLLQQNIIDGLLPSEPSQFPAFNYNQIFKDRSPCPKIAYQCGEFTLSGFHLSPLAACSRFLCENPPALLGQSYAIMGNLSAKDLRISNSRNTEPVILAATGFVDFFSHLILEKDTLLVAGGDLHISSLQTQPGIRVTLLSATGRVIVEKLHGQPLLKAIGRQGVELPPHISGPQSLIPPLRPLEVLGFLNLADQDSSNWEGMH